MNTEIDYETTTKFHAPSDLREQFQEWLDSYEPDRLQEIDILPVSALLDTLADCGDVLPADYCDQLEIPKGSTYAQAVADVRQWSAEQNRKAWAAEARRQGVSESDIEDALEEVRHSYPEVAEPAQQVVGMIQKELNQHEASSPDANGPDENAMTDTTNDWWEREQARRHRLLRHVKLHLSDSEIDTATDAFRDLLADAHEEMVEELLLPIFNWSDWWPKCMAAEILGLPTDEEYDWEELVDAFEAREGQDRPKQRVCWQKEGF